MKNTIRKSVEKGGQPVSRNLSMTKRAVLVLSVITALTFTAAYSLNISAESVGKMLGLTAKAEGAADQVKKGDTLKDTPVLNRSPFLNFNSINGPESLFAPAVNITAQPTPEETPEPTIREKVGPTKVQLS